MYKLLKKSDDPKLKDFVGRTVNVHERPDGNYEGMFNNENIIIQKDCLARAKAEEGAKSALFIGNNYDFLLIFCKAQTDILHIVETFAVEFGIERR